MQNCVDGECHLCDKCCDKAFDELIAVRRVLGGSIGATAEGAAPGLVEFHMKRRLELELAIKKIHLELNKPGMTMSNVLRAVLEATRLVE